MNVTEESTAEHKPVVSVSGVGIVVVVDAGVVEYIASSVH